MAMNEHWHHGTQRAFSVGPPEVISLWERRYEYKNETLRRAPHCAA